MDSGIVEKALSSLGKGFDITSDFRLKYCKGEERLVVLNKTQSTQLAVPGFGVVEDVSVDIKCDKGDCTRYQSDILDFNQMSELFNRKNSLPGKIPSGLFNSMYGFDSSSWAKDAANTKNLAFDALSLIFFNLRINRYPLVLSQEVKDAVPTTWNPSSLARFIENYGTHIVVAVSVGGQDAVLLRQDQSSNLQPSELKQHLNDLGDQLFTGTCTLNRSNSKRNRDSKSKAPEAFNVFYAQPKLYHSLSSVTSKNGVTVICSKRGGDTLIENHSEWLQTVPSVPDAIDITFLPITSLLKGVPGNGFLYHAINLYMRYKPPIEDLQYFLDFQSHKLWAPVHNDFPLGHAINKNVDTPALQFNLMGPKLLVNTTQVVVGSKPVTGIRLYLEGVKCNRLAMHLQHPATTPVVLQNKIDEATATWKGSDDLVDERYFEAIQWKKCSHVCTAPVVYDQPNNGDDNAFIVTGAQLHVKEHKSKNVLHLRLLFSSVFGAYIGRSTWEQGSMSTETLQKSNFFSNVSTSFLGNYSEKERVTPIVIDSGVFPTGPPLPVQTQKLLRFVDLSQLTRGPQDTPGYWIVTGAKLDVDMGKICLHVKFSLLCFS